MNSMQFDTAIKIVMISSIIAFLVALALLVIIPEESICSTGTNQLSSSIAHIPTATPHYPVMLDADANSLVPSEGSGIPSIQSESSDTEIQTMEVPFLYDIKSDRVSNLSPEQQETILKVHEEFIEFYRSNPSAFYDEERWSKELGALREKTVNAIGIDSLENIMK